MDITSTRSSQQGTGKAMDSLTTDASEASVRVLMNEKLGIFFLWIV